MRTITANRYFPEPDLPPLHLDEAWIADLTASLPELPAAKVERYMAKWELSPQDAAVLAENRDRAEYFETVVAAGAGKISPHTVGNWMTGEIFRLLNESGLDVTAINIIPQNFVRLMEMVEKGDINRLAGKEALAEMWRIGADPDAIVAAKGLRQINDLSALDELVTRALAENPDAVTAFKGGKERIIGFLVGQVMRMSRGKANPKIAEQRLRQKMSE